MFNCFQHIIFIKFLSMSLTVECDMQGSPAVFRCSRRVCSLIPKVQHIVPLQYIPSPTDP